MSMIALPALLRPTALPARHRRLSAGAAFALQVSIVVFLLAGSSAPTPLYAVYQAAWGFSPITVTFVFGVYALAVLTSLLTFGSLSDHVGRRPVLLAALALQAATMLLFAAAGGVRDLVLARVLQGLATGAAVSALSAGLLDLHRVRGALASAVAPMAGTAIGALGSSLLVQYLPAPTHLVYLVLLVVFVLQAIGVVLMPETAVRKPGALASLKPSFAVPVAARQPLLLAIPALIAVWALGGFYLSLGPALVRQLAGSSSPVVGGLAPFAIAASGVVAVLLMQTSPPRRTMLVGSGALLVGVALTLLAISRAATAVLFVGAVVAGVGFGAGFQGALRTVVPLAAPHERAGLLSTVFVVSYLALGVPAVSAGVLAVHGGVLTAGREYGLAVMVLAALALLGQLLPGRPRASAPRAIAAPAPRAIRTPAPHASTVGCASTGPLAESC